MCFFDVCRQVCFGAAILCSALKSRHLTLVHGPKMTWSKHTTTLNREERTVLPSHETGLGF